MEENEVFGGISFVVGIIFLVVGFVLHKFPPKSINWFYGYRTPASMRTQQRWDFAQRFSAIRAMVSGVVMMVISVVLQTLRIDNQLAFNLEIVSIFISVAVMLVSTERAISKNFTK